MHSNSADDIKPGSVEKHASIRIFAKLQKHTNMYNSLPFPDEMNTSFSKKLFVQIVITGQIIEY